MAKVVRLFNKEQAENEELINFAKQLLEKAENGELKNILISSENKNGDILTGYCNLDVAEKQYMLSHIQVDINYQIVEVNADLLFGE